MKAVYIYDGIIDPTVPVERETNGIIRKIKMQVDALERLGVRTRIWSPALRGGRSAIRKVLSRLPLFPVTTTWPYEEVFEDCDFVYIRKGALDLWVLRFLRRLREKHPRLAIFYEVPTYPYDSEMAAPALRLLLMKERFWRKRLHAYVDRIVTFSGDGRIWGIPTVRTQNGIDVDRTPAKRVFAEDTGVLHILAVAVFSQWHGFDRLLRGLAAYRSARIPGDPEITLHMVGEGPSGEQYRRLTEELGLGEHVIFYGSLHGAALDDAFDRADVAAASLGIHRIDLGSVSTLKAREYSARGIPFIKAYGDKSFDDRSFEFAFNCPADESPIDLSAVAAFVADLRERLGLPEVAARMRAFAIENLTWEKCLTGVVAEVREIRRRGGDAEPGNFSKEEDRILE